MPVLSGKLTTSSSVFEGTGRKNHLTTGVCSMLKLSSLAKMQNQETHKLAKVSLILAIIFASIAVILGILHSQFADPESYTPAPWIGFGAFLLGVLSWYYFRHAKKQGKPVNKLAYLLLRLVIIAVIIYVLIGVISFGQCLTDDKCQLFAP